MSQNIIKDKDRDKSAHCTSNASIRTNFTLVYVRLQDSQSVREGKQMIKGVPNKNSPVLSANPSLSLTVSEPQTASMQESFQSD